MCLVISDSQLKLSSPVSSSLTLTVQAWEEFPTDAISTASISAVLHDSKNLPFDTAGVQVFDAATSGRAGLVAPGAVSRLDLLQHSHLVCAPRVAFLSSVV